jgi:CPA2 family monovalent cation:H+ antiporter-2
MTTDPIFFRDLAYVFVAAVLGGGAAWVLRQPLILGYVAGGILIGPFTPGPTVSDVHTFELFAEIGVVLLMFSIGIEFSLRDLARVRWVALLGGPLGILLCVALSVGVGLGLGWPLLQGIVIGIVISVASTMVLARLLLDRGELHSRHGRIMIGITLVEDLAVVVLTVLVPILGIAGGERLLALGWALAKAAALLIPLGYLASRVVSPLMTRVARTHNPELFLLVALAIGLGAAAVTQAMGLSLALGAFLAGLLISDSDYAHETLARVLSLRDAFVALFFVTIGALVNPLSVVTNLPLLGAIVGLVVVGKLVVWTLVVSLFEGTFWTALRVAVGLTQIGEFSFILVQVARQAGHISDDVYNAVLATSLLTILINALLVKLIPAATARIQLARQAGAIPPQAAPPGAAGPRVVLCGFGRVGSAVGEALETFGISYTVIEIDPDIVKLLRGRGVACLFGDAVHAKILGAAGAAQAELAVVTIPEIERARLAVRQLRALNPGLVILARAHHGPAHEELAGSGATEVVQPELEAAATLIRHALARLGMPSSPVMAYLERFRDAIELRAARGPNVRHPLPEIHDVTIEGWGLADQSLREARLRERFGVTVVSITRADGSVIIDPDAETVLRGGDRVRVFGLASHIAAFRSIAGGPAETG